MSVSGRTKNCFLLAFFLLFSHPAFASDELPQASPYDSVLADILRDEDVDGWLKGISELLEISFYPLGSRVSVDTSLIGRTNYSPADIDLGDISIDLYLKPLGIEIPLPLSVKEVEGAYFLYYAHPQGFSRELSATALIDREKEWFPDSLIGFELNPNTSQERRFAIIANSEDTIEVEEAADMLEVAKSGDNYQVGFACGEEVEVSLSFARNELYRYSFAVENEEEYLWKNLAAKVPSVYFFDGERYTIIPDCELPNSEWFWGARIESPPSNSFLPRFGPIGAVPELDSVAGVSIEPLSLEPLLIFDEPVTVYLPCPGVENLDELEIYCHDPYRGWRIADFYAGIVPDSRCNHPAGELDWTDIPAIKFETYQSGAFQAGREGVTGPLYGRADCFIATACFGSPLAREVETLRCFRDRYLLTNRIGENLVRFYYRRSPPIARLIRQSEPLKKAVRLSLRPLIWLAQLLTT